MSAVVVSFAVISATILGFFLPTATYYGWPEKEFFHELPEKAKTTIILVSSLIFHSPVFVSSVFYFVLLRCEQGALTEGERSVQLTSLV